VIAAVHPRDAKIVARQPACRIAELLQEEGFAARATGEPDDDLDGEIEFEDSGRVHIQVGPELPHVWLWEGQKVGREWDPRFFLHELVADVREAFATESS